MALQVPSVVCRTQEKNQFYDLLQLLFDLGGGVALCRMGNGQIMEKPFIIITIVKK